MNKTLTKRWIGVAAAAVVGLVGALPVMAADTMRDHGVHFYGKPRPPVAVSLVPGMALASGVPGQLKLQVRSGLALTNPTLVVQGDAGLAVVGMPQRVVPSAGASRAKDGLPADFKVDVTPTSGGTRVLSGLVTYEVGGVRQAAPFRISVPVSGPVTVAPIRQKPARAPVRDAAGELIYSMPAETTVRQ